MAGALAVAYLLAASPSRAADCVDSSALLVAKLLTAQIDASPRTINLVQGTYSLGNTNLTLAGPMTILGGFTVNCGARNVNATNTVVDMGGTGLVLDQPQGSPIALIQIDGLTVRNASRLQFTTGQYHGIGANDSGAIRVSRSRLSGIPASANAFYMSAVGSGDTTFRDVVLDHLPAADSWGCGIIFAPFDDGPVLLEGITADLAGNTDLCVNQPDSVVDIYNSVIWSSDGAPSAIAANNGVQTINIVNTLFHGTKGSPVGQIIAPLQVDPQWINPASGNYHVPITSPAVNSGTPVVPSGGLAATDIEGNPRWIGSMPDRGAYESPFNDLTNFSVTKTADAGAGSLRDAITQANSSPNPGKISFNITGACPQVISLASALPTITSPVIIDGYSQPGSSKNNDADAFNATLCVIVEPASGSIGTGFAVPAGADQASLTLRGLGLGGFGQALLLIGGSNHVIAGNQIGGSVGGIALPGAALYAVSIGVNASGSLIVGGSSLADRNVIGAASQIGINVQSGVASSPDKCQVVNNLVGVGPNGNSALPNFTGISLGGSGCSVAANRVVGNTQNAIWINGGNNNIVQRNILGVTVSGGGLINNGAGVRISNGSGNVIGTSGTSSVSGMILANTIRYMVGGGVVVASGTGNSVRSNLIYDNGLSADGMDIDLGATGATPNDTNDPDSGANNLQNFPYASALYYLNAPAAGATNVPAVLTASLNSLPGGYRVDAYFSNRCDNGAFHVTGRGHAVAYAGTRSVTIAGGSNNVVFSMPVSLANVLGTGIVSLTATDTLGNTSEIGSCFFLSNAQNDKIFVDGFTP